MPFPKPGGGSGLDQLTGDVTAGPGTGSQAATLVGTTNVDSVIAGAPSVTDKVPLSGGTMTGQLVAPDLSVSGLTGATAASRYVGATTSGAPTTGTFAVGDFVIDQTGFVWVCTTAGTPGTWTAPGGAGALASAREIAIGTTATTVVSYTPTANGNFVIGVYFRVITATTAVTIGVTWDDVGGAQTLTLLSAVSETVGSYALTTFMVDATTAAAINVSMTAGTAGQLLGSATIIQG